METEILEEKKVEVIDDGLFIGREEEIEQKPEEKELKPEMENDFLAIVLYVKNLEFKGILKSYEIEICGKKMHEWVEIACEDYKTKTTTCTPESDILALIKPLLDDDKKYTFVFFSDTPLLTKDTIEKIKIHAIQRDINVLKLARGYVFNTEYIKNAESISAIQNQFFNEEDFITASSMRQISIISDIMKNRILNYHMENGVRIKDVISTFIDADVIIEQGTEIYPNNSIKGNSYIGRNCKIKENNIIENSIISDNCIVINSYIKESRISENMVVGPYEIVEKKST